MVIRYAMLVALAAASVWAVFDCERAQHADVPGRRRPTGAGRSANDVAFWLLAAIATLITLSLCRFVIFGLPSMVDGWYQEHKQWIYTHPGRRAALRGVLFDVSRPNPKFWGSLAGTFADPRPRGNAAKA